MIQGIDKLILILGTVIAIIYPILLAVVGFVLGFIINLRSTNNSAHQFQRAEHEALKIAIEKLGSRLIGKLDKIEELDSKAEKLLIVLNHKGGD